MPYDYPAHNQRMVEHFLWLETIDPAYARYALKAYQTCTGSPNPNILADVRAEKLRRTACASPPP